MSKFQTVILIFLVLIVTVMVFDIFHHIPLWAYLIPVILCLVVVTIGVFNIKFNFFVMALNAGKAGEKKIAITFDDGPCEKTETLLKILRKYDAKATFFCIGKNIIRFPVLVKKMDQDGHIIGNHTTSHHHLINFYRSRRLITEIEHTDKLIKEHVGKKPLLFRPPYGVTNPALRKAVKNTGHTVIGWSMRSLDTVRQVNERFSKRFTSKISDGSVILLHEHVENSEHLLEEILQYASKNGYRCLGIDKMFNIEAYA